MRQMSVFRFEVDTQRYVHSCCRPVCEGQHNRLLGWSSFAVHRQAYRRSHGPSPTKFLAYLVVLCFESRYPKQNTVAHLK